MTIPANLPLASRRTGALKGIARVPGDKSISHRTLILGLLAAGETRIEGLLEADDVKRTAAAVKAFGGEVHRDGPGRWRVWGVGVGGLMEPLSVLDLGNSGTGTRLLMGAAATTPIVTTFAGDASLSRRPMDRVVTPLEQMGASFRGRGGNRLPMTMTGARDPMPVAYRLPVASAQVKSAILLAGLNTPGNTTVIEPAPTRDHTERMLRHLGAEIEVLADDGAGRTITLAGEPELAPGRFEVPADPSSAAFPLVGALLVEGSEVTVPGVSINPLRAGLYETLQEMGAVLEFADRREVGGEPVADITARASRLRGVTVPAQRAPSMIDEYPVLAIAAAFAEGTTVLEGLSELRVKESDRLAAIAAGLREIGVGATERDDGLTIEGCAGPAPGGGWVTTELDHRIAMAFLTAGLASEKPVAIDDGAMIETSFPDFVGLMTGLGASIDRKNR